MTPRSSNLSQAGVIFTRQVILEKTDQVLGFAYMLAPHA
jgi:hypothetical protein